jgi:hypothetical protein
MIWMFAGSAVSKLAVAAGGMALLSGSLNNADTWVSGTSVYTPAHAQHLSVVSNAQQWRRVAQGRGGVVLDLERWPFTPKVQQSHPVAAYRFFFHHLSSARSSRWIVATPAFDLVKSAFPHYQGRIYPEFIRRDLAGRIARYAQVYEIQAQGAENNPILYRTLVMDIASQVRAVNPSAIVLAGLSTNPSGRSVRVSTLLQDIRQTRHEVRGYWFNIPQSGAYCPSCGVPQTEKAVKVLEYVKKA